MSIPADAKWPPESVDPDDLDQSELAKEQRDMVSDPTATPSAGLGDVDADGGDGDS